MKALIRDKGSPQYVNITHIPEPIAKPHQALVKVKATSVNRGELALLKVRPDGWAPGQDFAGIILRQAADGSGPKAGTHVVGQADEGTWAEQVAVDTNKLVELPTTISFEDAATLPLAGVTALRTLRLAPHNEKGTALITAGNGGVGFYQIQLADMEYTHVTTVVRNDTLRKALQKQLPTVNFIADIELAEGLYGVILDAVGGPTLGKAILKVAPEGTIVSFGNTTNKPTPFSLFNFMPGHENARILTYFSYYNSLPIGKDLMQLTGYMATDKLMAPEKIVVTLADAAQGISDLVTRKIHGKLVLTT